MPSQHLDHPQSFALRLASGRGASVEVPQLQAAFCELCDQDRCCGLFEGLCSILGNSANSLLAAAHFHKHDFQSFCGGTHPGAAAFDPHYASTSSVERISAGGCRAKTLSVFTEARIWHCSSELQEAPAPVIFRADVKFRVSKQLTLHMGDTVDGGSLEGSWVFESCLGDASFFLLSLKNLMKRSDLASLAMERSIASQVVACVIGATRKCGGWRQSCDLAVTLLEMLVKAQPRVQRRDCDIYNRRTA